MRPRRIRRKGGLGGEGLPPFLRAVLFLSEAEGYPAEAVLAKAEEALEISEDCYTAYMVFAEHARTHEDRIKFAAQAVAATRRLEQNPEYAAFNSLELSLHGNYLAVLNLLAQYLCEAGRWDEAIPLLQELVNDESGFRDADFRLLFALLVTGRFAEAEQHVRDFGEPQEDWFYSSALIQFGLHGDGEASRRALAVAIQENPLVPDYLTGRKPIAIQPVSELQEYAEDYVADFWPTWVKTPGALQWLAGRTEKKLTLVT